METRSNIIQFCDLQASPSIARIKLSSSLRRVPSFLFAKCQYESLFSLVETFWQFGTLYFPLLLHALSILRRGKARQLTRYQAVQTNRIKHGLLRCKAVPNRERLNCSTEEFFVFRGAQRSSSGLRALTRFSAVPIQFNTRQSD